MIPYRVLIQDTISCRPVNGREAYFGMSIDLTTRFYSLAEEFKDAVAYLFRLNRGREENYFYYYP